MLNADTIDARRSRHQIFSCRLLALYTRFAAGHYPRQDGCASDSDVGERILAHALADRFHMSSPGPMLFAFKLKRRARLENRRLFEIDVFEMFDRLQSYNLPSSHGSIEKATSENKGLVIHR